MLFKMMSSCKVEGMPQRIGKRKEAGKTRGDIADGKKDIHVWREGSRTLRKHEGSVCRLRTLY